MAAVMKRLVLTKHGREIRAEGKLIRPGEEFEVREDEADLLMKLGMALPVAANRAAVAPALASAPPAMPFRRGPGRPPKVRVPDPEPTPEPEPEPPQAEAQPEDEDVFRYARRDMRSED